MIHFCARSITLREMYADAAVTCYFSSQLAIQDREHLLLWYVNRHQFHPDRESLQIAIDSYFRMSELSIQVLTPWGNSR